MANNKKIFANYTSSLWSMFANFVFLPLFLVYLGPKQFGIFALITILQSGMSLLDFGISATVKQGMAVGRNNKLIINTYEPILVLIIALIALVIYLLSSYLLNNLSNLAINDISSALFYWVVLLLLSSMMINFYTSILWGVNRQVEVSLINIFFSATKHIGGVIIAIIYNEILYVIIFQATSSLVILILIRGYISFIGYKLMWFKGGVIKKARLLRVNSKYTIGALLLSTITFLNYQFDKIVLTSEISIEFLGYYSLLFMLSQVSVSIASPLSHSYYHLFVKLIFGKDQNSSKSLSLEYSNCFSLLSALLIPVVLTLLFFGYQILEAWTMNSVVAETMSGIIVIMVIAGALQSLQTLPYNIMMAAKQSMALTKIYVFVTAIYVLLCLLLIQKYGLFGAAISWLSYNIISTALIYIYIIKNYQIQLTTINNITITFVLNLLVIYFVFIMSDGLNVMLLISILIALMLLNIRYLTPNRWQAIFVKKHLK
jgi:O-antigen/teichoic acid export membrane protein